MPYIGRSEKFGVRNRFYYTQASGGATSISGNDDAGKSLSFTDGAYVDVALNGVTLVAGTDYNTTTANTIAGLSALSAGDIIEILVYDVFNVADTVSATSGGTFSGGVTATGGLNVGTIKEATGTTTAMTIDSTGRILTPARPAFRGYRAYTSTDFTTETVIAGYTEDFDIGSCFNHTTGIFTAPVTGIYQINVQVDMGSNTSAATQTIVYLYTDGVRGTAATGDALRNDPENGQSLSMTMSQTKSLTAGKELKVSLIVSTDTSIAANFTFSGFLVG